MNVDSQLAIGLVGAALASLTCAGSAVAVLWKGAKWIGRAEKAVEGMEGVVALVSEHAKGLALVKQAQDQLREDQSEQRRKLSEFSQLLHNTRGRLESHGQIGE